MKRTGLLLIALLSAGAAVAADAPQKPVAAKRFVHPSLEDCGSMRGHGMMGHGMGGYGMGGYGMGMGGYGMMGSGRGMDVKMLGPRTSIVMALDLSDDQRSKINKLVDKLQHDNWATMGTIMDDTGVLRDLYQAEKRDPEAIDQTYRKIFDLKRQMIKAALDTENAIEDLLTPDQLKALRSRLHPQGAMAQ